MVPKKLLLQPTGASGGLRGQALEGFLPLLSYSKLNTTAGAGH